MTPAVPSSVIASGETPARSNARAGGSKRRAITARTDTLKIIAMAAPTLSAPPHLLAREVGTLPGHAGRRQSARTRHLPGEHREPGGPWSQIRASGLCD